MMYKWGHPVANLSSDGGDYTSLSLNDVNSANQADTSYDKPKAASKMWIRVGKYESRESEQPRPARASSSPAAR
eukprot:6186578-Pleurochrysis_carterae.AAC.1